MSKKAKVLIEGTDYDEQQKFAKAIIDMLEKEQMVVEVATIGRSGTIIVEAIEANKKSSDGGIEKRGPMTESEYLEEQFYKRVTQR